MSDHKHAGLVSFLERYCQYLMNQVSAVESLISDIPVQVLDIAKTISRLTEDQKLAAENVLDETYLKTDAETASLMNSIQGQVDDIFEMAINNKESTAISVDKGESIAAERFQRFGGLFSKHMEALSTIDDAIKAPLLDLVGNLSNDDILAQGTRNAIRTIEIFKNSMNECQNIINSSSNDLENRLQEAIERMKKSAYASFSMVGERKAFESVFGSRPG